MQELLEQIHRRWESDSGLTAVVPAERFTTADTYHLPPYVVLPNRAGRPPAADDARISSPASLAVRIVCDDWPAAEARSPAPLSEFSRVAS